MIKKGRLLAFLYIFPPKQGTAALRNYNQFKELSESFEKNYLYTNAAFEVPLINTEVVTNASFDYRTLLLSDGSGHSEEVKNNWFSQFIIKLLNTFPVNIIFGEGGGYYVIKSYLKALKQISTNKITHIYSSYRPFADHYIAYRLKKKFPELIWIADFRDLIIDPHYDQQFFPKLQHQIYKNIFKKADVLTTVSDGLINSLLSYNNSVLAIPNGIESNYVLPLPSRIDKFNLVYTGAMFLDERNGEPVFAALRNLINDEILNRESVEVIYAGKDAFKWKQYADKYQLSDLLKCVGQVSQDDAIKLQEHASINILLSISSDKLSGVTTGKFIEYLKAGSPILAIFKDKNDESMQNKLTKLNIGAAFSDHLSDLNRIQEFVLKEYNYWLKHRENRKPLNIDQFKNEFDRKHIFKPLIELI